MSLPASNLLENMVLRGLVMVVRGQVADVEQKVHTVHFVDEHAVTLPMQTQLEVYGEGQKLVVMLNGEHPIKVGEHIAAYGPRFVWHNGRMMQRKPAPRFTSTSEGTETAFLFRAFYASIEDRSFATPEYEEQLQRLQEYSRKL